MRKVLSMLLLIAAVFSNAQTVITLNGTSYSEVTMPRRNVEEVDDGIIVTYYFDNAITQQDLLYPGCVLWKIPGFGLNETAGEPAIPFRWDSFSLPQNTSVSLEVLDSSFVDFSMQLSPARPALFDSDTVEHTLENISPIAPYDGFHPASLIESSEGNAYRGVPLLEVGISPLQYNYNQQVIRSYKMIRYKISFLSSYRTRNVSTAVGVNDNYLSITTINPSEPIAQAPSLGQSTEAKQVNRDYLIITNSILQSAAENFAEWKRTLGFRTSIAINDNWSIEAVKDTISQYYNNPNNNLYYLLILGDENVVPATRYVYGSDAYKSCVTDLDYACMDGRRDNVPDVYYGRIPTNNLSDALIVFNKIRGYEELPITDWSFYNTAFHSAYFQDDSVKYSEILPDGYEDRRFVKTSEEILQYVQNQGKTINRVYYTKSENTPLYWNNGAFGVGDPIPHYLRKPTFSWNGDSTDVINKINEGCFYVLHRGHGEVDGWDEPKFRVNHVDELSNKNKLPVVISLNCLTGRYQESAINNCLSEALLKKENGGAVAVYAATGISFSGYNDALAIGMFDAIWPNPGLRFVFPKDSLLGSITPTPTPTYELGQILKVGMARMRETWGAVEIGRRITTQRLFHLFGDPSMQIYTECPTKMQTPDVYRVDNTIYVETKDGDARISFYTPSTQQVDTYYGTNVSYQIASDEVVICISRHNNIPYVTNANSLVYIQNENINGNQTYLGNTFKIGRNVTDKKTQGDVIFNSGNVNIIGNSVELQSGAKVSIGAVLKIGNP